MDITQDVMPKKKEDKQKSPSGNSLFLDLPLSSGVGASLSPLFQLASPSSLWKITQKDSLIQMGSIFALWIFKI